MADDSQSIVSSGGNLLDEVDAVLADLTSTVLPGYAATVRETEPARLEALMSHWLNLHLTEDLKGKQLTEALGQIAVMMVTQLKALDKEMKQALQTCRQLEEERSSLKKTVEGLDRSLAAKEQELENVQAQSVKLEQVVFTNTDAHVHRQPTLCVSLSPDRCTPCSPRGHGCVHTLC